MKKTLFNQSLRVLSFLLMGVAFHSNAQILDTIEVEQTFFGKTYYFDGKLVPSYGKMKKLMDEDTEAYQYISGAKAQNSVANVMSFIGGFIIGYQLAGEETNTTSLGLGIGLVAGAIPISIGAAKKAYQSVLLFNKAEMDRFGLNKRPDIRLQMNARNIGLVYKF